MNESLTAEKLGEDDADNAAGSGGRNSAPGGLQVAPAGRASLRSVLHEAERHEILSALEQANWVVAGARGAAARLGMKRSTLQFRMRKLGISRPPRNG